MNFEIQFSIVFLLSSSCVLQRVHANYVQQNSPKKHVKYIVKPRSVMDIPLEFKTNRAILGVKYESSKTKEQEFTASLSIYGTKYFICCCNSSHFCFIGNDHYKLHNYQQYYVIINKTDLKSSDSGIEYDKISYAIMNNEGDAALTATTAFEGEKKGNLFCFNKRNFQKEGCVFKSVETKILHNSQNFTLSFFIPYLWKNETLQLKFDSYSLLLKSPTNKIVDFGTKGEKLETIIMSDECLKTGWNEFMVKKNDKSSIDLQKFDWFSKSWHSMHDPIPAVTNGTTITIEGQGFFVNCNSSKKYGIFTVAAKQNVLVPLKFMKDYVAITLNHVPINDNATNSTDLDLNLNGNHFTVCGCSKKQCWIKSFEDCNLTQNVILTLPTYGFTLNIKLFGAVKGLSKGDQRVYMNFTNYGHSEFNLAVAYDFYDDTLICKVHTPSKKSTSLLLTNEGFSKFTLMLGVGILGILCVFACLSFIGTLFLLNKWKRKANSLQKEVSNNLLQQNKGKKGGMETGHQTEDSNYYELENQMYEPFEVRNVAETT